MQENKSPARKLGQIDNRGSHFYLALFWAEELANQSDDRELKEKFTSISKLLNSKSDTINNELIAAQGQPIDIDGYYFTDTKLSETAMRPSETLNNLVANF